MKTNFFKIPNPNQQAKSLNPSPTFQSTSIRQTVTTITTTHNPLAAPTSRRMKGEEQQLSFQMMSKLQVPRVKS